MEQEYSEKKTSPFAASPYESPYTYQNNQEQKPKKEKMKNTPKRWISILLVVALVVVGCGVTALSVNAYWNNRFAALSSSMDNKLKVQQEQLEAAINSVGGNSSSGTQPVSGTPGMVYAQNVQAVVAISNQSVTTNFFGQVSETASSGSGFIVSEDGYVVSNYHVVKGATKLRVIMADSKEYAAELVGYDVNNDISVLKIDAQGLPCVKLGSSDKLAVGDLVAAIGNPLGELTSTLTVGYVSAKDRTINTEGTYINMIQTDAAINSGNSGGPLFNMQGEVIGITTAKMTGTSGSGANIEGLGFAIPIDDVKDMITQLIENGYVKSSYMGVVVRDMDPEVADTYGFPAGVYVDSVEEGGPADQAGIRAKDIIVNVGGYDTASMAELTKVLRKFEPGQTTSVTVYRSGAEVHLEITLAEKLQQPQEQSVPETQPQQQPQIPGFGDFEDWFGGFFPGFG